MLRRIERFRGMMCTARFDMHISFIFIAIGWWIGQPGWMLAQFPLIARELTHTMPLLCWSLILIIIGLAIAGAVAFDRPKSLAWTYMVAIFFWAMLGLKFFFTPVRPPIIAAVIPVHLLFSIDRFLTLPDNRTNGTPRLGR